MAVILHRCKNVWAKLPAHPCWNVQKALDEAGISYEISREPWLRSKRDETERRTGQTAYPWIEFEDGSIYREASKEMARRIKDGKLNEAPRTQAPAA